MIALSTIRLLHLARFPSGRAGRPIRTLGPPLHHTPGGALMPTINEILQRKGSQVFTIGKGATVLEAAILMNEHKVGGLVVIEDGRVAGMFTERDVLRRVVGEQRDPARTTVAEVMT